MASWIRDSSIRLDRIDRLDRPKGVAGEQKTHPSVGPRLEVAVGPGDLGGGVTGGSAVQGPPVRTRTL